MSSHGKYQMHQVRTLSTAILIVFACSVITEARPLKLHAIFTSHMVLQRAKPIKIWGWADAGDKVSVTFGDEEVETTAVGAEGRWEVIFAARDASAKPLSLVAATGDEKVAMKDILIGDVWVATGQSNMAFSLEKTTHADLERAQANLPLLRHFRIQTNEQATLQTDIQDEAVVNDGWEVSMPDTAGGFSAIGYCFGSRIQRALQIPIGVISNARGGASIESLVPAHKFDDHPLAKHYFEWVEKRIAEFDPRARALEKWQRQVERAKSNGKSEAAWPPKPVDAENLVSWDIPGMSPSDAASVYNGMFGVFKGFNIKGAIFHQGYNNALFSSCRPKLYRVLMKLMVEGWREDFDANLPVGVIGFCAGGNTQNEDNFEALSYEAGPYIRESQRLGLADVGDPEHTAFIPAYDVQVPGLHPKKKRELGERAARWALARIYRVGIGVLWEGSSLVSVEPQGDEMTLTFEKRVVPDDKDSIIRGFSIAGEDGKFFMAYARHQAEGSYWERTKTLHVWSPLVEKPVAIRYGWATSPLGNLKVDAHPGMPLPSFRTDAWDLPVSNSFEGRAVPSFREMKREAAERCEYRRAEEAKRAVKILERVKTLGQTE